MNRPRQATAKLIWEYLVNHGDSDKWAIRSGLGLSEMQFWYGLGYLRDVLQTRHGQPLVWSPKRGVYALTSNEREWADYTFRHRLTDVHTRLSRIEQTAIAGGAKFGRRKQATRVAIAGVTAARQMVEALLP